MRALALLLLTSCAPVPWIVNYTHCTPNPGLEITDEDGTYRLVAESEPGLPCARALYDSDECMIHLERCTCGGVWLQAAKVCTHDGMVTGSVDETVCYETKIMQGTLVLNEVGK